MSLGIVFYHNDAVTLIPKSEEEGDLFLQRIAFMEYMSDPRTSKESKAIQKYAKSAGVHIRTLRRWKSSPSFQALVARRCREMALGGEGLAAVYREAMKMINNPKVSDSTRQKLISNMMRLDQRRLETLMKMELAEKRLKKPPKVAASLEKLLQQVQEAEVLDG